MNRSYLEAIACRVHLLMICVYKLALARIQESILITSCCSQLLVITLNTAINKHFVAQALQYQNRPRPVSERTHINSCAQKLDELRF